MKPPKNVNNARKRIEVARSPTGQHPYRVCVTDTVTGDVVYDWTSKAFLLATCEDGKVDSATGSVEGKHQFVGAGHPMLVWFLLDQMNKAFMAKQGLWAKVWEMFEAERNKMLNSLLGGLDLKDEKI